MLVTCQEYAKDKGLTLTMICIRAIIVALRTQTEGWLVHHARGFASLHAHYQELSDPVLDTIERSDDD
jgi:hypothetical protein